MVGDIREPGYLEGGDFFPAGRDLALLGIGLRWVGGVEWCVWGGGVGGVGGLFDARGVCGKGCPCAAADGQTAAHTLRRC